MKAFAFGSESANQTWEIVERIKAEFSDVEFVKSESLADIFSETADLLIFDVVSDIEKPEMIKTGKAGDKKFPLHNFDLGFLLQTMKDAGKISNFQIIGIPVFPEEKHLEDVRKLLRDCLKKKK
jgi:hypothetical protein